MKILNLMILATLFKENKYGLQIIKDIKNIVNFEIDLKLPSLYNSIKRMEGYGYLESYWENSEIGGKRRYCSLTEKGRDHLLSQKANLSEEDKTIIENLMDNAKPTKVEKEIELTQSPIAIQPNFLSQCYDNTEQKESAPQKDNEKTGNVESYEQFSIIDDKSNSTNQQSFDFKDIFGDIVYENKEKTINEQNSNFNKNVSDIEKEKDNSQIDNKVNGDSLSSINITSKEGLITDTQALDENYKINVTLKAESSTNKKVENNKSQDILFNNLKEEASGVSVQNVTQTNVKPKESNIMSKCLRNFDKMGITYSLYDVSTNTNINEEKDYKHFKKFYKNKFKLMQFSITSIITFLLLISVYIVLDSIGQISELQKVCYVVFCGCLILGLVFYLIRCLKEPNQLYEFKKMKPKNFTNIIYISCVLLLIIIAICFFAGMTFFTIKNYLSFIFMPVLFLLAVLINCLIGKIMVKNNKFFIKN